MYGLEKYKGRNTTKWANQQLLMFVNPVAQFTQNGLVNVRAAANGIHSPKKCAKPVFQKG